MAYCFDTAVIAAFTPTRAGVELDEIDAMDLSVLAHHNFFEVIQ
jgi:hypothetical protein